MKIFKMWAFLPIYSLLLFSAGSSCLYAAEPEAEISKIDISASNNKTIVAFQLTKKAEPASMIKLQDPHRLVIELNEKQIYYDQQSLSVKQGLVSIIRFELKKSALVKKEVEYIAVELNDDFIYETSIKNKKWIITFKPRVDITIDEKPFKSIKGDLDLEQAITIARANNAEVRLAEEKIDLARLRRFESLRALFPAMTGKYEQTTGESRGEQGHLTLFGFKEKFISLQLSQPLYQGGKLKATYEQACIHLEINTLQRDKIIQDLEFEVRKAFMNAAQQQKNYELYENLVKELKDDFNIANNLSNQKLNTRVEFLNVKSKYKQSQYQLASIKKDLALAKAQLLQILNLDSQTLAHVEKYSAYTELDISLEKLLHQMRLNRPDIKLTELELKLSELNKKIGHSGKDFKIELSGTVGRSASHYQGEELDWKNDFSGGVKLSKPFGGSTVGGSYLYDDTSAKLGQSSRTLSKTGSGFISILDNIKSLSDAKESDILLRETSQKLIESKRSASIDVKENFYNYQKAVIQMQGIQEEIELNKRELAITRQKKDLNLAQISELVDSKIKLAGTTLSSNETLTYYHVSLAGINKSIGLINFYKP
ncbi:MAG: TolC family protein [bacterium]